MINHDQIAHALCGKYTKLSDRSGYVESPMEYPSDGTLIGAYVMDAGDGRVIVTDDGDTAFHIAVAGAELNSARMKSYRQVADSYGLSIDEAGVLGTTCRQDELIGVLASYMQAVSQIAQKGLRHRPKDDERFESVVCDLLIARYGERVTRRAEVAGLSGHQIRFPFAIAINGQRHAYVQTIAAEMNVIQWKAVYEAGGKFKDVRAARRDAPLIAVLEASKDSDNASRFFADIASVIVYDGMGALNLDFALAA